jgi:hypothetical protein
VRAEEAGLPVLKLYYSNQAEVERGNETFTFSDVVYNHIKAAFNM